MGASTTSYRGYHWDGDNLAFTSLQNGFVNDYKLGSDGDFLTNDVNPVSGAQFVGAIYYDRNDAGDAIASHSAEGHSGFCQTSGEYGFLPVCDGTPSGRTPAFYTSGFGPDMTAYSHDGVTNGFATLQGVRNYETATGQWTTPDAAEGTITDPRSQAKYMWNNNNPYMYSDPSGYQSFWSALSAFLFHGPHSSEAIPDDLSKNQTITSAMNTASNTLNDKLKPTTINYAINEALNGRKGDDPDHVNKVQDAIRSLNNQIAKIEKEVQGNRGLSQEAKRYARSYVRGLDGAIDHVRDQFESRGVGGSIDWSAINSKFQK